MADGGSIWDILRAAERPTSPPPTPQRPPRKRRSEGAAPARARARVETPPPSVWDVLASNDDDVEMDDDDVAPPLAAVVNAAVVTPALAKLHAHVDNLRALQGHADPTSTTATTVPFQLPREADRVFDVGAVLAEMPSALIEELATNRPRAFLTESPETTARRTALQLFEHHTRCLRGTRGTHWVDRLSPWAGIVVATREPANMDSSPLRCLWSAVDVARRTYSLVVFELMPSFYVATVFRVDGDATDSVYVGAFYMQSEQSHVADSQL